MPCGRVLESCPEQSIYDRSWSQVIPNSLGSDEWWFRRREQGHEVRLMPAQCVSLMCKPVKALRGFLQFLIGEGRTIANCWAVDLFLAESAGWERDWNSGTGPSGGFRRFRPQADARCKGRFRHP